VAASAAVRSTARRSPKPDSDPRYRAVSEKIKLEAQRLKKHAPAAQKVRAASLSAKAPENEQLAGAKARVVDEAKEAPTPKPQPTSFKALLRAQIEQAMPKTLGDTEKFMSPNEAGALKQSLGGNVDAQKHAVTGPVDQATQQAPNPGAVPVVATVALANEATPPAPQIDGAAAMPAPLSAQEVSLDQSKEDAARGLAANQIQVSSLKSANDPRFSAVVDAQSQVNRQADAAPKAFRGQEGGALANAQTGGMGVAIKGASLLTGARGRGQASVVSRQQQQALKEAVERKQVADKIEGIFSRTKQRVELSLASLQTEVSAMFDTGVDQALSSMKSYVDDKLLKFKFDRYLSIPLVGIGRWLRDQALGLPSEVNAFYKQGRVVFQTTMDALIDRVTTLVESRMAQAKAEISTGQGEIKSYVARLPVNLKTVGESALSAVNGRFEELSQSLDDKQNEIASSLANKYKEAFEKVDASLQEMQNENQGLLQKFAGKLAEVVKALTEFKAKLMAVLKKGHETILLILADPIAFLGHLLDAVKGGFQAFVKNIWTHLREGFMSWLFGSLAKMGIAIPADLTLPSILKLVLSVLGITYEKMRAKAVKLLGPTAVGIIEKVAEYVKELITGGPQKLWEKIKEDLANLKEMVVDAIQNWLIETVVKQAVLKVVSMFNPAGAIVQAVLAIYNVVMFVIEKAQQLMALVESVVNSVSAIATGNIGSAIDWIEKSLAKAVPVVIGFLARLLGLSGISDKIREFIVKIQDRVDKAIDKVIAKVVETVKKLFGAAKSGAQKLWQWLTVKEPVDAGDGEKHTLQFDDKQSPPSLVIHSKPQTYQEFLKENEPPKGAAKAKQTAFTAAQKTARKLDAAILAATDEKSTKTPNTATPASAEAGTEKIRELMRELAKETGKFLEAGEEATPRFGPLRNGFGTSATVEALGLKPKLLKAGTATDSSTDTALWNRLKKRRHPGGTRPFYVKGHLQNHYLGGTGKEFMNLTPISRTANSHHYHQFEQEVKEEVKDRKKAVRFVVVAEYGSRSFPAKPKLETDPKADATITAKRQAAAEAVQLEEKNVPKRVVCSALGKQGFSKHATIENDIEEGTDYRVES